MHASGRQGLAPGRFRLGARRSLSAVAEGAASGGASTALLKMAVLPPTRLLGLPEANFILTCLREMNRLTSGIWAVKERSPGTADYKAPGRNPSGALFSRMSWADAGRPSCSAKMRRGGSRRISSAGVFRVAPHAPRRGGPRHAVVLRIGSTRAAAIPAHGGQALLKR